MKRIIVTRFSAMGDVAMVASVLKEFQRQHTDIEIIMVSRKLFKPFFTSIPRLQFHGIDPKISIKVYLVYISYLENSKLIKLIVLLTFTTILGQES